MEPPKIKNYKRGPERIIQEAIIAYMRNREWMVVSTHGNLYQSGFPDLYCTHAKYGVRWVEVKNPLAYSFTPAQLEMFPRFSAHGTGIWILTAATEDQYRMLWKPANWWMYMHLKMTNCNGVVTKE